MLSKAHDALSWVWSWTPYVLPAFSNLILVLLGVIMSLPNLADTIEKTPRYRRTLSVVCLVFGIVGFIYDVGQRRSADSQTKQLLTGISTDVQNTKSLLPKVDTEVTNTNGLVTKMDTELTRTTNLVAAQRENNRQLTDLMDRELQGRRQDLLAQLSEIIDRLQAALDQWRKDDAEARSKAGPRGRNDPVYITQRDSLREQYASRLKQSMIEARSIREELYSLVPDRTKQQMGIPSNDSRLGRASLGTAYSDTADLILIIQDLTTVHQRVSALSTPPQQ